MKFLLVFLLAMGSLFELSGQDKTVLLKDGTVVQYTRLKKKKDFIEVQGIKGEWTKIQFQDIEGFCNPKTGDVGFELPLDIYQVKRILEGKISVYQGYEAGGGPMYAPGTTPGAPNSIPGGQSMVMYAEKDEHYTKLRNGKEKAPEILSSLILDAPEKITIVSDTRYSDEEILQILRDYNLQFHEPVPKDAYIKTATIQVLLNSRSTQPLQLLINDSLNYQIPKNFPLSVQLPFNRRSKVCVISPTGKYCDIVSPSPCAIKYFEVKFNERRNDFEMQNWSREEMQKFLLQQKSR